MAKRVKEILNTLRPFIKGEVIKLLLMRLGASVTGPIGIVASLVFNYLYNKGVKKIFLLFKKSKRSKAKDEIEQAKDINDLKNAVDDFID